MSDAPLHFPNPYPDAPPAGWKHDCDKLARQAVAYAVACVRESFDRGAFREVDPECDGSDP